MSLLSTIIEHLTSITEKLNEISVNSKRVDELPIATNGSKLIAVFNQSNSKTQKQSLTDLLATISNQDNFNVVYEISSSLLTTNDISGLLNYINNLPAPSLVITQVQSSVKYKIIETGDVYELVGIGKGTYGIAFGQLTLNNILLINSNQNKNEFKTLGTTILTNSDLLISLGYSWEYNSVLYSNPTAKNFPIPFTTAGKQRIDIFVATTNNNFARIQGVESVSSPVKPDVPQNTLELTFVLVSDAEIADPVLPNFGETFVEKIEKTEIFVNTNNIFNVSSRVSNYIFDNNVVQCSGFNFTDNSVYYYGKKYSFKNNKTTDIILKNRTLVSGNVRFAFANNLDFILKPGEIVEFILRKRKFLFLEYVGVLAQKRTFNWHQKGRIYTNVFGELNAGKWLQTHIFDPNSYAINTFQTNSNLIPVNYSTSEFQIPFDCKLISVTGIGAAIDGTDVVIFCSTNLQGNNKVQIYSGIFPNFSSSTIVIADYKIVKNSFIHVFYKKYTAGQNFYMHNIIFEEI